LKSINSARDEIAEILGQVVGDPVKRAEPAPAEVRVDLTPARAAELGRIREYLEEVLSRSNHNLAVIAVQTGRADEALGRFGAAARWKADLPGLDRNWGVTAFRAGRFEIAAPALSRHLAANPNDALVRRMLGASYYFISAFDKSVETLKPLEQTITGDPELAYFYGISLIRTKGVRDAAAVFSKLAEAARSNAAALSYAAQGFMMLGDFDRAVKEFTQVAALDPVLPKTHYFIGVSLIRLNRLDEAEKAFVRELEVNPYDAVAKYHLALTLTERRIDTDRAVRILEEAIALKSDYADARYQLGKILIDRGEIPKAIEQLEAAVAADATKDYIHYQLSIAYRRASRKEDADRELKIYQELKSANRKSDSPMGSNEQSPQ
jgi:tetratricopeptide (TPR) repeat protein